MGDVAVEDDEVTRAGGLTAGKDFILSLINFISLSTFEISAILSVSISSSSLCSLTSSFGCLSCFAEACLISLDVKWHFLLFLLRIVPYFGGRTGKMGKCPSTPSILSGRNGHILRIPSIPYHCLPSNQENHTFYLDLADFLTHTLKEAL